MKKILIIEDDLSLLKLLAEALKVFKIRIELASNMTEAQKCTDHQAYSLIIADRMLGEQDTIELIADVRSLFPATRILILSGLSSTKAKLKGFSSGADDYLVKPFSLRELIFRIKRLLYSERISPEKISTLGPIKYFRESKKLVFPENKIAYLNKSESKLLECFLNYRGRLLSRSKLAELVWPELIKLDDTTVDVAIRRLRKKLGNYSRLITNKRGLGFGIDL